MNYSSRTLLAALALLLAAYTAPVAHAQESDTTAAPADTSALVDQARAVAEDWLALIDAGNYAQSWEEAASMLQEQVTKEQWAASVSRLPQQLGALQERSLDTTRYTTQLPQAPEGEYVVLQYRSAYENADAREVVVLTREAGAWKVAGYFARPAPPERAP